MKRIAQGVISVLLVFTINHAVAQEFAVGRPSLTVSVDGLANGDCTMSDKDGKDELAQGRVENQFNARVSANLGLFRKKLGEDQSHTLAMAAIPYYNFSTTGLRFDTELPEYDLNMPTRHHRYGMNIMAMYNGHAGKVPLMVMAMPFVDFSQYGYERTGAVIYAMFTLKRTQATQFGVSAVLLLGTSSPWPLFPCIYLTHKFNDQWGLSINGRYNSIYYKPNDRMKFSGVVDMLSTKYYLRPNGANLPEKAVWSQSYFKSGLQWEYNLTNHLTFNAFAGANLPLNGKVCATHGSKVYVKLSTKVTPCCKLSLKYKI